jgi:inosine-uridine nucleoside N-ribohydrolase
MKKLLICFILAFVPAAAAETEQRLRLVIDTDAANEIDDQFALTWALLSSSALHIEAINAAPFSIGAYLQELQRGRTARKESRSFGQRSLDLVLSTSLGRRFLLQDTSPGEGMRRSLEEIHRVIDKVGLNSAIPVYAGSTTFLPSTKKPLESEAAKQLIHLALQDDDRKLYVAVLGAPTNIASAIMLEPKIVDRIVVVFVAGYPSGFNGTDDSFNLLQDRAASNILFSSGVTMVYVPGYQVAEQVHLSSPEIDQWIKGRGEIGDYLKKIYDENPLYEMQGITDRYGRAWIMWDMAPVAWLLNREWVPSHQLPAATIGVEHRWQRGEGTMTEAYNIKVDEVMRDFLGKLDAQAGQ